MGHAGSDAEIAYRPRSEILADYAPRPAARVAPACWSSGASAPDELLDRYEATRRAVMDEAEPVLEEKPLEPPRPR